MSPAEILNVSGAEIQNVMASGFDCFLIGNSAWKKKSVEAQWLGCATATWQVGFAAHEKDLSLFLFTCTQNLVAVRTF